MIVEEVQGMQRGEYGLGWFWSGKGTERMDAARRRGFFYRLVGHAWVIHLDR